MKIITVGGARPNFMKIAPLISEIKNYPSEIQLKIVHTGQHYDFKMSKVFFEELGIPEPDYFLNVGSGSHAIQTARIMIEFEKVCLAEDPNLVVVVGDVNSTLACSITAKKLNIKVAHIESGLRSGDITMPEEVNRIVTDSISDLLFVSEPSGVENLKAEGKMPSSIHFVGNIMIDTLFKSIEKLKMTSNYEKKPKPYGVVTLHRPSNVDQPEKLRDIMLSLLEISKELKLYFPAHPRTKKNIETFGLNDLIKKSNIQIFPPMAYLEFLLLWKDAVLVLTDSGGLQEETTALGIPCFTLRENTERPITIDEGTNTLVGTNRAKILDAYENFKAELEKPRNPRLPKLWDGKTAKRIVEIMCT